MTQTLLKQRQTKLKNIIRSEILTHGPMPFSRFFDLAMYHKTLGYYSSHSHPIGTAGDFTTAPELSPLLAKCLSETIQSIHEDQAVTTIVELGAGTGRLMIELMRDLQKKNISPHYKILDTSPSRVLEQKENLKQAADLASSKVEWIQSLPTPAIDGIIIANEVLDAIAFERFLYQNDTLSLLYLDENLNPHFLPWTPNNLTAEYLKHHIPNWPNKYQSEIRLLTPSWITSLSKSLRSGAILILDYGSPGSEFYHPERQQGTLRCYHQHKWHDNPFINIGQQDITCDVDFTNLAMAANQAGLRVHAFLSQMHFLMNTNAHEKIVSLDCFAKERAKRIMLPNQMGSRFKLMGLTKGLTHYIKGLDDFNQNQLL